MTRPGSAPPQYRTFGQVKVISLRVLFVALTLLSFGIFSWAAMLRIAILRRRRLDWVLFCAALALLVASLAFVGSAPSEDDWRMDVGMISMLLLAFGVTPYYLVVDIQLHDAGVYPYPPVPPAPYGPPQPYAAPFPAPPYGYPPEQPHRSPQEQPPGFPQDQPPPPPPRPAPHRIDQVRAELDELSRYLRKEDGR